MIASAFPKNNSGRDVMLDAPSAIDQKQLDELNLIVEVKDKHKRIGESEKSPHVFFVLQ